MSKYIINGNSVVTDNVISDIIEVRSLISLPPIGETKLTYTDVSPYVVGYFHGWQACQLSHDSTNPNVQEMISMAETQNELLYIKNKIDSIDNKYDTKLESIHKSIYELGISLNELKSNIKSIDGKVNEITTGVKDKGSFWKQYILAPIITGIVVGIILLLAGKININFGNVVPKP
jgi:peptidoglycan hydrolase CwlO-like protein